MAPATTQPLLLSPAELSYLHTSLSSHPTIRPDGRTNTQFRPLIAETDILPTTNGSARICFADGTEAIVGIKAEVEKSGVDPFSRAGRERLDDEVGEEDEGDDGIGGKIAKGEGATGRNEWVEISVEIPGCREDDSMVVFVGQLLSKALLSDGEFAGRLWINGGWHWKLYVDILLLSQPLSYPLPLLSLTTHLALLSTRLPKLKSELEEDPLFDDDWEAATYLYPRSGSRSRSNAKPPITLLVMAVQEHIIFDPTAEELAVADSVLAVSVSESAKSTGGEEAMQVDSEKPSRDLRLLSVRTIDPPSRLTYPGVPNFMNTAAGGEAADSNEKATRQRETMQEQGVWQPPRGGMKRKMIASMIQKVLERGGVAEEVMDGLEAVELG